MQTKKAARIVPAALLQSELNRHKAPYAAAVCVCTVCKICLPT